MISYSNEMAQVADTIGGIDVADAFHILHMDKRWGGCNMTSYVYPGCGYGGYCLPKDTSALLAQSVAKGYEPQILKNVISVNDNRAAAMAKMIADKLPAGAKVGILGLSFKPESDDVRDTAAYRVIKELNKLGFTDVVAYDPVAMEEFKKKYQDVDITYMDSAKAVYDASDAVAVVTAWSEFKNVPQMGDKPIFDLRYMFSNL
jgi:UDPglucose 6-dehydrogenase